MRVCECVSVYQVIDGNEEGHFPSPWFHIRYVAVCIASIRHPNKDRKKKKFLARSRFRFINFSRFSSRCLRRNLVFFFFFFLFTFTGENLWMYVWMMKVIHRETKLKRKNQKEFEIKRERASEITSDLRDCNTCYLCAISHQYSCSRIALHRQMLVIVKKIAKKKKNEWKKKWVNRNKRSTFTFKHTPIHIYTQCK